MIVENVKFYNLNKLRRAERVGGEDFEAVKAEYVRLGGLMEEIVAEKPKRVAKKTTAKKPGRAKKTES